MYEVEISAGEIRSIIWDYQGTLITFLGMVVDKDDPEDYLLEEPLKKSSRAYIEARINYLETKLGKGC